MSIVYCGIAQSIIDRYRDEIEKWATDPASPPVYGLKLASGAEADLVKRVHGGNIHVSPERYVDEQLLSGRLNPKHVNPFFPASGPLSGQSPLLHGPQLPMARLPRPPS